MSELQAAFTNVLNMSITASYVAAVVILVRFLLQKAKVPKIFSYALWSVVLFRLICPFSLTSDFSLLGFLRMDSFKGSSAGGGVLAYVPSDIGLMPNPTVQSGITGLDRVVNSSLPPATPLASVNPMQIWLAGLSLVWLVGVLALVIYSVSSYIKTKRVLETATLVKDNIYESDRLGTALVYGFIHPKIYVPMGVTGADLNYILAHEQTHIQRRDYLIKPLAFFALILHWFNPLMWLAFVLMSRDMEMSCDESVLRKMGGEAKAGYSSSLLALSVESNGFLRVNPLAFGETHVKSRVKNILNYKKPAFWVVAVLVIALGGVVFSLISNPVGKEQDLSFLNPDNLAALLMQGEGVQIYEEDYPDPIMVSSVELGKWLASARSDWKEKKVSSPYELTPSYRIQVNPGNEIRFFEAEPTLVMIQSGEQYRYYAIPKEDFRVLKEIAELGYPRVTTINITKWEKGNSTGSVRITDGEIMKLAVLLAQGEENFLGMNYSSMNDIPPVADYVRVELLGQEIYHTYYVYAKDGKNYYIERPYLRLNRISSDTAQGLHSVFAKAGIEPKESTDFFDIEHSLNLIMSSPQSSSNPQDYIRAHEEEYEKILKFGGDEALLYLLSQFEQGNAQGLRGHIMMRLCKDILGARNTITDETLSPQEWYKAISAQELISLPDYTSGGKDWLERLVYATETQLYSQPQRGFTVVAPKIFGSYEEGEFLKVFVTTYSATYILNKSAESASVREVSGGVIPAAITYKWSEAGKYELVSHEQARDGAGFSPSIRQYCRMPISGKEIPGLADEILKHYGNYEDLHQLQRENLLKHLQEMGVKNPVILEP